MVDVPNPVSLPSFYCMYTTPFLLDTVRYFVSHTIGATDRLYSFPAARFKTYTPH
jgi:hypothetical protein